MGLSVCAAALLISSLCCRRGALLSDGDDILWTVPPLLRYGKYCGILYSGCAGEKPCDGLDACCQIHDVCVQSMNNDYLSQRCNRDFLNCMERFRRSGRRTFRGNQCDTDEVVDVISFIIQAALVAGRALHRP